MTAIPEMLHRALAEDRLAGPPHAAVLYDLDQVGKRIEALRAAFPSDALHALAIKACPISELLRFAASLGCGAEVASEPELRQALRLGFPAERVVFDSPVKTPAEIELALAEGVLINADSLQEIDRIADLKPERSASKIGVRINPSLRAGSIAATSTATPGSKFGVSLADDRSELLDRFELHPWLTGLHLHVGSQGCDLGLLLEAADALVAFAAAVEERTGAGRIQTIDLGGGLSAAYHAGETRPGFAEYTRGLRERLPRLFAGEWRLVTEFGRAVWANAGIAVSRVEYTKTSGGHRIAAIHLGADMFLRTAYVPEAWHHEVSVFDGSGRPKSGEPLEQDVAGPLCFSGDLVARQRLLPPIEPNDVVVIHDAGAYTLGMWSRYNSRRSPGVYGYSSEGSGLVEFRKPESVDDVLGFWD